MRDYNRKNNKRKLKRKTIVINVILLFCIIIFVNTFIAYLNKRKEINNLIQESKTLEKETVKLNTKIKDLHKQIDELSSLDYIEKVAREKLGMIKKGDKIYIVKDNKNNVKSNSESVNNKKNTKEETKNETENETKE